MTKISTVETVKTAKILYTVYAHEQHLIIHKAPKEKKGRQVGALHTDGGSHLQTGPGTEPYLGQLGDLLAHLQVQVLGIFHSDAGLEGDAAGC